MIYDENKSYEYNCGVESCQDELKKLRDRIEYLESRLESTEAYVKQVEEDYDELCKGG